MWIPSKGAFRAGRVSNLFTYGGTTTNLGAGSDYWDDSNIGLYSFASGLSNKASGFASTALGLFNSADGDFSFTIGSGNTATFSGYAFGDGNDLLANEFGMAIGKANTINSKGYAFGGNNVIGNQTGFAFGTFNQINSLNSFAIGTSLTANSTEVMVFGKNNLGLLTPDVAFEFGTGTSSNPGNVLTMYGNGDIQFNELQGTGNAISIDANGFLSRITQGDIDIYSPLGNCVMHKVISNKEEDLSMLNAGIYIVVITDLHGSKWQKKIMKEIYYIYTTIKIKYHYYSLSIQKYKSHILNVAFIIFDFFFFYKSSITNYASCNTHIFCSNSYIS